MRASSAHSSIGKASTFRSQPAGGWTNIRSGDNTVSENFRGIDKILKSGFGRWETTVTDAFNKKGPTIYHASKLVVAATLGFSPPAVRAAVATYGNLMAYRRMDLQRQATNCEGCTGEQGGFQNGKNSITTSSTTGSTLIRLRADQVGYFELAYREP